MSDNKTTLLLDSLGGLLVKQIEMAEKSNFGSVETLVERANSIVAEIVKKKVFDQPPFTDQRERFAKLYKRLELMLTVRKDYLGKQLQQVNNIEKTLKAYHNNG